MTHRYVRHISWQGQKWKVTEPETTTEAWCVFMKETMERSSDASITA